MDTEVTLVVEGDAEAVTKAVRKHASKLGRIRSARVNSQGVNVEDIKLTTAQKKADAAARKAEENAAKAAEKARQKQRDAA